jgi:flavin-binding protein dodecin
MSTAKVIEIIGSSPTSWEDAAKNALQDASKTLRNIKGVEVLCQNAKVLDNQIEEYRTVLKVAFEYEQE